MTLWRHDPYTVADAVYEKRAREAWVDREMRRAALASLDTRGLSESRGAHNATAPGPTPGPATIRLSWGGHVLVWFLVYFALFVLLTAMCDTRPALAHGPGDPTGSLAFVNALQPPDEWCVFCLEVTGSRPETKTGGNVYILRVKDRDREIVIPWPEGMTATEALMAWRRSP